MARRLGADVVLDPREVDVVAELKKLTGVGVDVAIEALGTQEDVRVALRSHSGQRPPCPPWGSTPKCSRCRRTPSPQASATTASSARSARAARKRMRRLLEMVRRRRIDLTPLLTHRFALADIERAYALFGERADGVLKVAIAP
jgi:threonine dehydrogenase-like Zn-dependent dehydrogenase